MIKSSEIRQLARNKLAGNWPKAFSITVVFVAINLALSYCSLLVKNLSTNTPILYYSSQIIFTIILLPLSFGLISAIKKLIDGKNPEVTSIINDSLLNASKTIGIFFRVIFKILIPSIILILGCVGIIFLSTQIVALNADTLGGYLLFLLLLNFISIIIILILALPYVLSNYALAENNKISSKDAIETSVDLMKQNKWNFIKLVLSFFGWIILIVLLMTLPYIFFSTIEPVKNFFISKGFNTSAFISLLEKLIQSLGMIALLPYIISSIAVFYDELKDVKVEVVNKDKKDDSENN